jgi:hypothetical protein
VKDRVPLDLGQRGCTRSRCGVGAGRCGAGLCRCCGTSGSGRSVQPGHQAQAQDLRSWSLGPTWSPCSSSRPSLYIPALTSLNVRGRAPQPRLTERALVVSRVAPDHRDDVARPVGRADLESGSVVQAHRRIVYFGVSLLVDPTDRCTIAAQHNEDRPGPAPGPGAAESRRNRSSGPGSTSGVRRRVRGGRCSRDTRRPGGCCTSFRRVRAFAGTLLKGCLSPGIQPLSGRPTSVPAASRSNWVRDQPLIEQARRHSRRPIAGHHITVCPLSSRREQPKARNQLGSPVRKQLIVEEPVDLELCKAS